MHAPLDEMLDILTTINSGDQYKSSEQSALIEEIKEKILQLNSAHIKIIQQARRRLAQQEARRLAQQQEAVARLAKIKRRRHVSVEQQQQQQQQHGGGGGCPHVKRARGDDDDDEKIENLMILLQGSEPDNRVSLIAQMTDIQKKQLKKRVNQRINILKELKDLDPLLWADIGWAKSLPTSREEKITYLENLLKSLKKIKNELDI